MQTDFVTMAGLDPKHITVILLATFSVILCAEAVPGWEKLSKEEELDLDRQLKLINKPAIKSFQTEDGDVIDCVDIYKQHAFDHPMLKNHKIQMKPTTIPKGIRNHESETTYKSLQYMLGNISCPQGSVPIKRATRKDLIMARHIKSIGFNHPTNTNASTSGIDEGGHHYAGVAYRAFVVGGRANINVWNPSVKVNQFSIASMSISKGPKQQMNNVQVGWGVNKALYPDGSRLYTYWTGDGYQKTGCFNTLCPGFVQVSTKIHLGLNLRPVSTYKGSQFHIAVSIQQDNSTGNWLLTFFNEYVGYWPKALFTTMADGADYISWAGSTYSIITDPTPTMGSGHFPKEGGYGISAFVNSIQIMPNRFYKFVSPLYYVLDTFADVPQCYDVIKNVAKDPNWGAYIFFGGPGNCTFQ
ncbi:protein neprosin [Ziziphus jujuba]|uniref:Protein neprosin n=1 Tax=Ziziphus jujuba TaxID=326968 RepID=A0A6P6FU00_ZIZJJ|nr:protein neprosin [Ziziphus jujuba]